MLKLHGYLSTFSGKVQTLLLQVSQLNRVLS